MVGGVPIPGRARARARARAVAPQPPHVQPHQGPGPPAGGPGGALREAVAEGRFVLRAGEVRHPDPDITGTLTHTMAPTATALPPPTPPHRARLVE